MYEIERIPSVIDIGIVGETDFRTIQFDLTAWMADMPNGVPSIIVIRPGETEEDAYIATTTFENNILTWTVTESDTGPNEGTGSIQIWVEELDEREMTVNKRGKSALITTRLYETIASGTAPEPQESWIQQMSELSNRTVVAERAAQNAKTAAEEAQEKAEIAAGIAIAQAGQLKFAIDHDSGHLIMSYTSEVPIAEEE